MIRIAIFDANAVAEALAKLVHLDGMGERCPLAVLDLLGIQIEHVPPRSDIEGFFIADPVIRIGFNLIGSSKRLRKRASHEIGHLGMWLCGYPLPHREYRASEVGRALCMGRNEVLRRLELFGTQGTIESYSELFEPGEIVQRIYEVRVSLGRLAG